MWSQFLGYAVSLSFSEAIGKAIGLPIIRRSDLLYVTHSIFLRPNYLHFSTLSIVTNFKYTWKIEGFFLRNRGKSISFNVEKRGIAMKVSVYSLGFYLCHIRLFLLCCAPILVIASSSFNLLCRWACKRRRSFDRSVRQSCDINLLIA